jgi:hypothetical protein
MIAYVVILVYSSCLGYQFYVVLFTIKYSNSYLLIIVFLFLYFILRVNARILALLSISLYAIPCNINGRSRNHIQLAQLPRLCFSMCSVQLVHS